jgi:hypothetical protein
MRKLLCALISIGLLVGGHAATVMPNFAYRMGPTGSYMPHTALSSPGVGVLDGISYYLPAGSFPFITVDGSRMPGTIYPVPLDPSNVDGTGDILPAVQTYYDIAKFAGGGVVLIPDPPSGHMWSWKGTLVGNSIINEGGHIIICGVDPRTTLIHQYSDVTMFKPAPVLDYSSNHQTFSTIHQGATQVTLADASGSEYSVGHELQLFWGDVTDRTTVASGVVPVYQNEAESPIREHTCVITARSGNVLTYFPPLAFEPQAGTEDHAQASGGTSGTNNSEFGLCNLGLSVEDTANLDNGMVQFNDIRNSFIVNCKFTAGTNTHYLVKVSGCTRVEIRHNWFVGGVVGMSNHACLLFDRNTSSYVVANTFFHGAPNLEINSSSSGNVFEFNGVYATDGNGADWNINHNPINSCNLYISNYVPQFISDGYFGGSFADIFVGNFAWLNGGIVLRRMAYFESAYGNNLSRSGQPGGNFVNGTGIANIGGVDGEFGHSDIFNGVFPGDWVNPTQQIKLLSHTTMVLNGVSHLVGTWEAQGTARFSASSGVVKLNMSGLGFTGQTQAPDTSPIVLSTTQFQAFLESETLPSDGTFWNMVQPGVGGYQYHDDSVYGNGLGTWGGGSNAGLDFRANISGNGSFVYPSQSLTLGDTIWAPTGHTSRPEGNGLDEVYWKKPNGTYYAWYDNGGAQHGIINRSDPTMLDSEFPMIDGQLSNTFFEQFPSGTSVLAPSFTPSAGTYSSAQSVTISTLTSGATIHYTTNGSTPNVSSPVYSTPVTVSANTTLKAFAVKSGLTDSTVSTAVYVITGGGGGGQLNVGKQLRVGTIHLP